MGGRLCWELEPPFWVGSARKPTGKPNFGGPLIRDTHILLVTSWTNKEDEDVHLVRCFSGFFSQELVTRSIKTKIAQVYRSLKPH